MLDGQETAQIACGELCWEGARQHAGRTGNRPNSLRRASLGGVRDSMMGGKETVQVAFGELHWEGGERDSMMDRQETLEIACGELRWQHAGRMGNHANSLRRALLGGSETACWTDRKP